MLQPIVEALAYVALIWSTTVFVVQVIGSCRLFRSYSTPLPKPVSSALKDDAPHVTLIRPVKGLEPRLYECLASGFQQAYPQSSLTVRFCISSREDPAYGVLERLVADFGASFDVTILVESEDPLLNGALGRRTHNLGPNPKIRNISRAYREAKGDIIWIVDCNVWVSRDSAGRLVDTLLGLPTPSGGSGAQQQRIAYKFVHQLPIAVDITPTGNGHGSGGIWGYGGGRLDEMFMATTHAKFYSAINTVGIAPCVVGKSNMFRKSHLDALTDSARNPVLSPEDAARGRGVDFFSSYICEDHLIGDLFWRSHVPGHANHGLVAGEIAIQPMAQASVAAYWARRVRWLRARKWTVLAATLVEPGVESLLCCLYLSFAVTTIPWLRDACGLPQTWTAMAAVWATAVSAWVALDWNVYCRLRECRSIDGSDPVVPDFARGMGREGGVPRRRFFPDWLLAWVARELLALPIWTWAVVLGTTVSWRGKQFHVRMDMSVVEIPGDNRASPLTKPLTNGLSNGLKMPNGCSQGQLAMPNGHWVGKKGH